MGRNSELSKMKEKNHTCIINVTASKHKNTPKRMKKVLTN